MLYYGLLLSFFLDYIRPGAYIGIIKAIKIGTIVPLMVLLFSINHKSETTNTMVFNHPNTKWLIFFMFLLIVSVLTSTVTLLAYNVLMKVLPFIFWYYIIVRLLTSTDKLKGVFNVLVISHVIILILNPQVILDPTTRSYVYGNPFMGDGNDFSLSICITVPMSIYLLQSAQKKYMKLFYTFILLILIFAIIGTQSRGATLALAMVFLYLWWYSRHKAIGIVLIFIAIISVLL